MVRPQSSFYPRPESCKELVHWFIPTSVPLKLVHWPILLPTLPLKLVHFPNFRATCSADLITPAPVFTMCAVEKAVTVVQSLFNIWTPWWNAEYWKRRPGRATSLAKIHIGV